MRFTLAALASLATLSIASPLIRGDDKYGIIQFSKSQTPVLLAFLPNDSFLQAIDKEDGVITDMILDIYPIGSTAEGGHVKCALGDHLFKSKQAYPCKTLGYYFAYDPNSTLLSVRGSNGYKATTKVPM